MPSAPPKEARRTQARGAATRARVLEAAHALFAAQGVDATSVGQIAGRAGVGVGTLYHHFPDKRALLLELVDRWCDEMLRERWLAPDRSVEAVERLGARPSIEGWVRGTYDRLVKRPSMWVVVADRAGRDRQLAARLEQVQRAGATWLCALLEGLQTRGLVRAELDPLAAAWLVRDAVERAGLRVLVHRRLDPPPERMISELVEMVCRYLLVDPPSRR